MNYQLVFLTTGNCSPAEMINIAADTGYDSVSARTIPMGLLGEKTFDISRDRILFRSVQNAIRETNIQLDSIENARIIDNLDVNEYEPCLAVAAELGVKHVLSNIWTNDEVYYTEKFHELCELASKYKQTIDLEFVTWASVATLGDAVRLLKKIKCDNARIILDTLHFYRSNIPLEEIKSVPVSWLQCVHICDAPLEIPTDPKTLAQTAREERLLPGEGVIKIADIVSKMPVDATRGIEIPNIKRLGEYGVKEYARLALEKTKNYLRNAV